MVSTTNPHYITQNATGTSLTQPVDTVDFPHSGLIKALNQMAAGNVVVKTGTDFDINQTGSNLVVAAGKILRNGKYAEVATKTFADSSLTTTYAKGYHLLVVADGRESGETINVLYMRPPTANERVPEFKLGDTIVAMVEYSSSTSAGSRLIQYFTTNKESNSLSIAYADSNVYTQAMTVDASAGDVTFENIVSDKDIIFKVNDGGTPTEVMRIDGSSSRVGIGETSPDSMLHLKSASAASPTIKIENTGTETGEAEIIFQRTGTAASSQDIGHIKFKALDDGGATHTYAGIYADAQDETAGTEDGRILFSVAKGGTDNVEILRLSGSEGLVFNDSSKDLNVRIEGNGDANLFCCDGGTDMVGIGTNAPNTKLHVAGTIKTDTLFQGDALITASGPGPAGILALSKAVHLVSTTALPGGGPLVLQGLEATADNRGIQHKIIVTAVSGGPAIVTLDWVMSSQVLVDTTYAVIGGTGSPYTLAAGKVYDLIAVATNHWMLILLN